MKAARVFIPLYPLPISLKANTALKLASKTPLPGEFGESPVFEVQHIFIQLQLRHLRTILCTNPALTSRSS